MATADVQIHAGQAPRPASLNGLRLREDVAFTNAKGEEDKGAHKRVSKLLQDAGDVLQRLLAPEESVLYSARAQAPIGFFEQSGLGWYVYRVTVAALVFTNKRVLHLGLHANGKWKGQVKELAYGDLQAAKTGGLFSAVLYLTYRNGKKEKYWGIKRADAKKMKLMFDVLLPMSAAAPTGAAGMVSLCPDCWAQLQERVYLCPRCGLVFKDEKTMVKRSLLIPGGGYFYSGQNFLGVLDFMAEAWISLLLLFAAFGAYAAWGQPAPAPDNPDAMDATGYLIFAVFLAVILTVEKLMTIHHCRRFIREYISTGQKDPMRAQMAAAGTLK